MPDNVDPEKPLITDEDWKSQARKEKEKFDEKAKQAEPSGMPPASLAVLINSLALQAMFFLGRLADPNKPDEKPVVNLDMAKHHIDMLAVLEEKTKGNLTDEEKKLLAITLHELRMQYVQMGS